MVCLAMYKGLAGNMIPSPSNEPLPATLRPHRIPLYKWGNVMRHYGEDSMEAIDLVVSIEAGSHTHKGGANSDGPDMEASQIDP